MLTKLSLGAVVIAAAALLTPASAAPLSPSGVVTKAEATKSGDVQQAHWRHRRHWWRYYYYHDDDDYYWHRRHHHRRWWWRHHRHRHWW